jgi:hypothetical protein
MRKALYSHHPAASPLLAYWARVLAREGVFFTPPTTPPLDSEVRVGEVSLADVALAGLVGELSFESAFASTCIGVDGIVGFK